MTATLTVARPEAPFRGAEAFRLADRPIFHARDEETGQLLQKILIHRGVLLYGDQGAGKSSLINAGLVPAALERGVTVDRVLVQPIADQEILIERATADQKQPKKSLNSKSTQTGADKCNPLAIAALEKRVREGGNRHLVVFDQFEEIITRFGSRDAAIRQRIVNTLLFLFRDDTLDVSLLLVFREDYLAKIADLFVLAPEWLRQIFWLRAPEKRLTESIINAPFDPEKLKEPFEPAFSEHIVQGLTEQLNAGDSDRLNLTDLQIACLELWTVPEQDRDQVFTELQATGLIKRYLDHALQMLTKEANQDAAVLLLSLMVNPDGTRNVISENDALRQVRDLESSYSKADLKLALNALVSTRLVRREQRLNANYYDIVSEFLGPWIVRVRRRRDRQRAQQTVQRARVHVYVLGGLLLVLMLFVGLYFSFRAQTDLLNVQLSQSQQSLSQLAKEKAQADTAANLLARARLRRSQQRRSNMPDFGIFEMAFGVLLLYVVLSITTSVLNELFASAYGDPSRFLQRGVGKLLGDNETEDRFWKHPLIESLAPPGGSKPAYIPPRTFTLALLDTVVKGEAKDLSSIKTNVALLKVDNLRRLLLLFADRAETREELEQNIGTWFLDAMRGAAAAFKRMTNLRLLAIAFVLTAALNADTIQIANRLLTDSALRSVMLAQAQALADSSSQSTGSSPAQGPSERPDPGPSTPKQSTYAPAGRNMVTADQFTQITLTVRSLRFPIGWAGDQPHGLQAWTIKALGLALTAVMVLFGATFLYGFISFVTQLARRGSRHTGADDELWMQQRN